MVGLVMIDLACPVDLFKDNEPDHLVGKCHKRE